MSNEITPKEITIITLARTKDYIARNLEIPDCYDRVIIAGNGAEIFAYLPITGDDDLVIIERMFAQAVQLREDARREVQ